MGDGAIGIMHVERYASTKGGDPLLVGCECAIGHDHTYADWLDRFRPPRGDASEGPADVAG